MPKRILATLLLLSFLAACVQTSPTVVPVSTETVLPSATPATPADWWREAVFYEIFVRSFYDSDGNGIGDFNGITQKIDHLESLGITAIWLMPIHPSPSYHGYDVTDYYNINPEYGTMDDFKNLLTEAHERDMHVIIDLVLNHTSSQHPWFVDANGDPASIYRDYYVWSETGEGSGGWHAGRQGFYFGLFWEGMPDLNYNNPAVTTDMLKVTNFWLNQVGVDGFRVDAAKHLIEDGDKRENTPATHEWYKGFYTAYKEQAPQAYTVGEVFGAGSSVIKSYTGDQLDQIFNFEMSSGFVNSVNGGANSGVVSAFKFAMMDMPDFNYATFLTNHDQNRVMSVFNGDMGKAKAAAALLLTSPGVPFIYYGEEIGMSGKKPDEDIRLPMQWTNEANAGFSTTIPWRAPATDYETVNVQAQQADPDSLLNHYNTLIKLRKEYPALLSGGATLVDTGNSAVFAFLRSDKDTDILIVINLKGEAITDYALNIESIPLPDREISPQVLFGGASSMNISSGQSSAYKPIDSLPPYAVYILKLK